MSAKIATTLARDLQSLFTLGFVAGRNDGQLLDLFLSDSEGSTEAAFEALVTRHGPMVLRVCRQVLNDEHDAQDAFQATFLLLVRKAGTVHTRASVASWLHGVAHRVAWRAKVAAARRRTHERRRAGTIQESRDESLTFDSDAGRVAIDEEIRRLPEKYRAPVVLCYLEGLTQQRASEQLGWPAGTVRGRLARARNLLRDRLARRGVAIPSASTLMGMSPLADLPPTVPPSLLATTTSCFKGTATISSAVSLLVKGETVARFKFVLALLGIGVMAGGGALLVPRLAEVAAAPPQTPGIALRPVADASPAVVKALDGTSAKETPRPDGSSRDPVATARPLSGITIDGNLEDWPEGLKHYAIANQLVSEEAGTRGTYSHGNDANAYFTVGYDPADQRVYLSVIVPDDDQVVANDSSFNTDALEVFVDGLHSDRRIATPSGDWWTELKAAKMPALQYVAVPGAGRAYADPKKHNPSLMYGDVSKTRTKMAWSRKGKVTIYECAIEVFDHYPDQPTRLEPGKRIGLDVAIVDKDNAGQALELLGNSRPPSYVTWGLAPTTMKALDAGQLGDLILDGTQ